jgi:hypothetical protein
MLKTFVLPIIKSYAPNTLRHLSQLASGALVTNGFATADESQLVGGAILTLLSFGWSFVEKRGLLNKLFA